MRCARCPRSRAAAPPVNAVIGKARAGAAAGAPARTPFTLPQFRFVHAVCVLGRDLFGLHADAAGGTCPPSPPQFGTPGRLGKVSAPARTRPVPSCGVKTCVLACVHYCRGAAALLLAAFEALQAAAPWPEAGAPPGAEPSLSLLLTSEWMMGACVQGCLRLPGGAGAGARPPQLCGEQDGSRRERVALHGVATLHVYVRARVCACVCAFLCAWLRVCLHGCACCVPCPAFGGAVVPRRQTEFNGVGTNSVGYAGLMLSKGPVGAPATMMQAITGCAFPLA